MVAPHILVVDDEQEVRALLRTALEQNGYQVSEAGNGAAMLALIEQSMPDLITLDLRLSNEDGFTLAQVVRARHNVPIVMISGQGDMIDRVVGLELGADDFIAKPFHMREVIARIRAVLRRYEGATSVPDTPKSPRFAFEGWVLDVGRRTLTDPKGEACPLTTAEFNLLCILVKRPGRVLSRDELMDQLKGHDRNPLDRTIDGLVARLRKKIDGAPGGSQLVKTVRGVGYVFAGNCKPV